MRIFDTHAHYDDEQFDSDRDELLSELLLSAGVSGIVNMGADLDGCHDTVELAKRYSYIYGAVGIHPETAGRLPGDWLDQLKAMLSEEKIVAVGEIGLDYYYEDMCPKERQKEVFVAQLELAKELDLPVAVHDRDAHGDIMEILKLHKPRGVMHCFSGSVEMAREIVKLGMYIGIGGVVTFKNARHAVEVVADTALERLVLETDAPYLSPEPYRGKRNDARNILFVAEKVAEIKQISKDEVLEKTYQNAKKLYEIA